MSESKLSGPESLLVLQELDTRIDQLRHRREALPERAELAQAQRQAQLVEQERTVAQTKRDDLGRSQSRLEDEVVSIETKIASEEGRSHGVTNPKDAMALQEEIASLGRRKTTLEDHIIELMEQLEPVDEHLAGRAVRAAELEAERARLTAAITEAETEIGAELAEAESRRESVAADLSDDLMSEYARLRRAMDGVAVARFRDKRCHGCPLNLEHPAVEVDRIRSEPPGALIHCEECGRILVRD